MSQARPPQTPIADTVSQQSEDSRLLVRQEIDAAGKELWAKAKGLMPAVGLLGAGAVAGVFATASAYRFSLRVLDRLFPPEMSALVATATFAAASGWATTAGLERLKNSQLPLPTDTARATVEAAGENRES